MKKVKSGKAFGPDGWNGFMLRKSLRNSGHGQNTSEAMKRVQAVWSGDEETNVRGEEERTGRMEWLEMSVGMDASISLPCSSLKRTIMLKFNTRCLLGAHILGDKTDHTERVCD